MADTNEKAIELSHVERQCIEGMRHDYDACRPINASDAHVVLGVIDRLTKAAALPQRAGRETLIRTIALSYARNDLEPTSAATLALYRQDAEHAADAILSFSAVQERRVPEGRCDTTLTERFSNPDCRCKTYDGNLGPCQSFLAGADPARCVYCDHEAACHLSAPPAQYVPEREILRKLFLDDPELRDDVKFVSWSPVTYGQIRDALSSPPAPASEGEWKEGDRLAIKQALTPFISDDMCRAASGNIEGDASPIFQRDNTILTLGDFRRARAVYEQLFPVPPIVAEAKPQTYGGPSAGNCAYQPLKGWSGPA